MKTTITQTLSHFGNFSIPKCSFNYILSSVKFPSEIEFNQTYYKYENDKLIAFRVLAYAAINSISSENGVALSYLVQFPNRQPKWMVKFLTQSSKIFDSKEDFLAYQVSGRGNVNLGWECCYTIFSDLAYAAVIGLKGKVWMWDDTTCRPVNRYDVMFDRFLVCEDGTFINVPKTLNNTKYYLSAQECIKDSLDGMEIVEFAEEPYEIKINILPSKEQIHTLRFMEE